MGLPVEYEYHKPMKSNYKMWCCWGQLKGTIGTRVEQINYFLIGDANLFHLLYTVA